VVNWNSGDMLRKCLDGLAGQTRPPEKVVVADNGSEDGSAEGLEERYPRVDVLRLGRNLGFAAANNRAIALLETAWVALLNPDAFPEAGWLDALLRAAAAHPEFSLFASRLVRAGDPTRLDGTGDVYYASGLAARRDHGRTADGRGLSPEEVFAPCAAAALLPVEAFRRHGGFDESYFCYFEDVDLAFRLRLSGHRCLYVPEAVVHHVGSGSAGARSAFTLYHGHRNLVWTFFKDMPLGLLLLYLPQHLLLNLVSLGYFAARGQGGTIARAKWDAMRGLPRVLRERRRVQARRTVSAGALRHVLRRGLLAPYRERLRDGAR
jgi:GT2 family glycosyltransferase